MDKLSEQQQQFVTNYTANGFNARQAAMDAGYSKQYAKTQAHALTNHPIIKTRIERAYALISEQLERELSITIADKCKVLAQIIYDIIPQDGSEPKRKQYDVAIKAMGELSKMQGHYMPDKRLNVTVDATKEKLLEAKKVYEEF